MIRVQPTHQNKKAKRFWRLSVFLIVIAAAVFIFYFFLFKKNFSFFRNFFSLKKIEAPVSDLIESKNIQPMVIFCRLEILAQADAAAEENASSTNREFSLEEEQIVRSCFYLDEKGVVVKEAPVISGGNFLVIYDRGSREIKISDQALNPEILKFIVRAKDKTNLDFQNFTIISEASADLEALTTEGWKIFFDVQKDFQKQLDILNDLLRQQKVKPKEYLDLRIENRVYYK